MLTNLYEKIKRAPNTITNMIIRIVFVPLRIQAIKISRSIYNNHVQSNKILGRVFHYLIYIQRKKADEIRAFSYKKTAKDLAHKNRLNVLFFVEFESSWKIDSVYQEMNKNPRFNPIVIICPVVNYGRDNMIKRLDNAFEYFQKKGYRVYRSYDKKTGLYIDVSERFSPDIIFYTNPYEELVDSRYHITNFSQILSCYVAYGYNNIATPDNYALPFHNLLWRFYLENESIKKYYESDLGIHRLNHKVVGYPPFDDMINRTSSEKESKYKYVIWAPHHTLEADFNGLLHRNSFLWLSDFMVKMAEKYNNNLFIIFRPHPLLKNKLYNHSDWGAEKTESYYHLWASMENTLLSENRDYIDDFSLSDAMVHDCGSFTVEYIYTEKPVLFSGNRPERNTLVPSANEAFDCYQFANDEQGVEVFIRDLINGKTDDFLQKKKEFKKKYLIAPNNKTAAQNIVNDIADSIWNN